jgi:hypothetical protein
VGPGGNAPALMCVLTFSPDVCWDGWGVEWGMARCDNISHPPMSCLEQALDFPGSCDAASSSAVSMGRLRPMPAAYTQEKEQRPCTSTSKAFTSDQTIHVFFLYGCNHHHNVIFHTSARRWAIVQCLGNLLVSGWTYLSVVSIHVPEILSV